jgi:hypothetical protein
MTAPSVASRVARGALRQHLYATSAQVVEECKPPGDWCWSSSECCSGYCSWAFHCGLR